jgi:hypothetical protein
MNKSIIGILLVLAMAISVSAVDPFTGGWGNCNVAGNYGLWDKTSTCKVAWDPSDGACPEPNRDATFTVGAAGQTTTKITIEHLDGIAETLDSFQVLDGTTPLCSYTDVTQATAENWMTLNCPVDFVGEKTLTLHPLAETPWGACGTWGQLAIKSITFETTQIPEFGVIAAGVAMIGALAGLVLFRRH